MKKIALISLAVITLFTACGNTKDDNNKENACTNDSVTTTQVDSKQTTAANATANENCNIKDLEGGWNIINIEGEPFNGDEPAIIRINIAEKMISAYAGCNIIASQIVTDDNIANSFILDNPIATMKSCPNEDNDRKLMRAIPRVSSFKFKSSDKVELLDAEGNIIFDLALAQQIEQP